MTRELPFPKSLPEFQKLFPSDAACAAYMERVRWPDGFVCPSCETTGEPGRVATRPHVLRCKKCKKEARLTANTVMQAYLNEFTFRFNRRFFPFTSFRSLLGIGADSQSATYAEHYSGDWEHPSFAVGM